MSSVDVSHICTFPQCDHEGSSWITNRINGADHLAREISALLTENLANLPVRITGRLQDARNVALCHKRS